ncbi:MAG: monovalent cation:proton antiporter-2 (CPA2) family protein [Burkholderiaceae bacterium]
MTSGLPLILFLLAAAVIGVLAFRRLQLPPLLAYLVIGILVGPHAAALVPDTEEARYLAEFGVVFLMFSIGLEFSLAKLKSMRRLVFGLGGTQVFLTIAGTLALALVLGQWIGFTPQAAFVLGGAMAMSSTAIVMKMLTERLEVESEHGKRIFGVLLFQDLAVVPLLVIIPALASPPEEMARTLGLAFVKAAVVLTLLLVGGQRLMRWWFLTVARRRSHELFMLNLLLVTLGLAWITEEAGLSLALGAFVAGMLIAETEFRHQVEEDIKPFRDILLGFFFITIGMLLNLKVVAHEFGWVLLALTVPVAFKLLLIFGLTRLFRASVGTALRTGLALCTAGEFGFVLLSLGAAGDIVDDTLLQIILAAMLLSMMAAPLLVQHADKIVMRVSAAEWMHRSLELHRIAQRSMTVERHVVICGFGRTGQHLAKMLEQESIAYVALDLDPDRVREAAAAGDSVVYGDAARRETLVAAGVTRAAAMVVTYNDAHSAIRVIHFAHALNPALAIIVRTQDDADLDKLLAAGATEVVPEIFEGSLMLGSHALVLLGVPMGRVVRRVRQARESRYHLLRGYFHGADDQGEAFEIDAHDRLHSVVIDDGAAAVGRALGELGLDQVGAEVTAVRRHGIRGADPSSEMKLAAGDVVVLRGIPEAIEQAEKRLAQK